MSDLELLKRFLAAMDGEWIVERYSVDDNGKLRVHYASKLDPEIIWAHNPHNSLDTTPKIGTVGRLGFIDNRTVQQILDSNFKDRT